MSNIYFDAGKVLKGAIQGRKSVKNLLYNGNEKKNAIRKSYALICKALKYQKWLLRKIDGFGMAKDQKKNKFVIMAILCEIVYGKGKIQGGGHLKRHVMSFVDKMTDEVEKERSRTKEEVIQPLRFARVNTLKASQNSVMRKFVKLEFTQSSLEEVLEASKSDNVFHKDQHIKNLLVFPSGFDLHDSDLVKDGLLILQDKASCCPAILLSPTTDSKVIDACAAPGNKTSHLAALVGKKGKVIAFERDEKRSALLQKRMEQAGAENVECLHEDFLSTDPTDVKYADVKGILVDPTCSGSGMPQFRSEIDALKERAKTLCEFQVKIVSHAMAFPSVDRVVYSTCSIFEDENESVVKRVLDNCPWFELVPSLPSWSRRGESVDLVDASKCVRFSPEDRTNGFFAATFQRIQ